MNMVDKVAAAIMSAQAHGGNLGAQARAAIEAMRGPTEFMLAAVDANGRDYFGGETEKLYTKMIGAALTETNSAAAPNA